MWSPMGGEVLIHVNGSAFRWDGFIIASYGGKVNGIHQEFKEARGLTVVNPLGNMQYQEL